MIRLIVALFLAFCGVAQAQGPILPGPGLPVASAPAYTGPGDVVSGAYAWYGLRGYTAAYSTGSNPALDLVDQAGANPITINILSNGRLDVASINSWVTANSVSTIKVTRMYDQSGNGRHVSQATLANMPVLNLTGFGSLPAVVFTTANSHRLQSGSAVTLPQPVTFSAVFNRNSGSNTEMFEVGGGFGLFFNGANTLVPFTGGSSFNVTGVADATWHAAQAAINGASSVAYVDGASTGGTLNTNGAVTQLIGIGAAAFSSTFGGSVAEAGIWSSAFNGTQAGNMNTNQHGTNGYNF